MKSALKGVRHSGLVVVAVVLSFLMALVPACASSSSSSSSSSSTESSDSTTVELADFHNTDIGCDLKITKSMELSYATCFSVDYYKGGYKLLCLSDGGRYLTVPKDKKIPSNLSDDIVVLKQPLSDIYLVASDTGCLIDALDELERISISGISQDEWYIDNIVAKMKSGEIVYGGKYNAPDYELITSMKCPFAIESTMINHTPEVKEKLEELGVAVLTEQSSYEDEPLGRTEWIKLYGALFNKEDVADKIFEAQVKKATAVEGADTGKTVAFFYINSNGAAVVRKPGDYVTKMIDLAGGDYIFSELDESSKSTSTVTLEMEQFYATAKDADIIIYNATIDGGVDSIASLENMNKLLSEFKAVQNGDVWCTDQNMYQQMVRCGAIISDFNKVFTATNKTELSYLYKLPAS